MATTDSPNTNPNTPVAAKPPKPHARLEKWIWILIYGGLFGVILGIATGRTDAALGWSIAVPGGVVALVGFVLIYVRSRLSNTPSSK
ncbi:MULTISPECIES: hypothetical protein [Variovorax]|jgi:predicted lipid-binding transport protein (Tim44 family)|uniref:hypothetical protein n=1 Tax=Variovorax TaxID=34072 RepID=UPI0003713FB2|nr:hypothetical protein [Variovorax paradoxus]MDR6518164.1 putative lipid-binding transport protein (Tim44 family) [Variovorax paradoxus]